MRNITVTCPQCHATDKAVGDPKEADGGHSGSWYCFSCRSSGTYETTFTITHQGET